MLDFVGKGVAVVNDEAATATTFGFGFFCAGGEFAVVGDGG